jgi:sulfur-oxidizing protein SoxA
MRAAALALLLAAAPAASAEERRSGFADMSTATQAMQADDAANPGMLWVLDGESRWSRTAGRAVRSCAACHGDAAASMRGVAARYPAIDAASGEAIDLAGRIALCQARHQEDTPAPRESEASLALTAFVAHQSRGMPIAPPDDPPMALLRIEGQAIFRMRRGQLNLSCAQCHDDNAGRRLAGSIIPQGHATGYPLYRLEWQTLGSLQRRFRGCTTGVRAEPFAPGSRDAIALEAYLMSRAAGMPIEAPAVRP